MRLLSDISEDLFGQFVKSIQPTALNAQPVGLSETQAASFLSFKPDILLSTPTTTGGNDNIDAGFLTMSINGGDGMDHLTLDYSGADADGNVATSVRLILNSTSTSSSNTELVYFTTARGTSTNYGFHILGFETYNITGSSGNDIIRTSSGDDVIYGLGGNDTISAGAGNDIIYGGAGNDYISTSDVNDIVHGGSGIDRLSINFSSSSEGISYSFNDVFGTRTGFEHILGTFTSGDDLINLGYQRDSINGGDGMDHLTLDYSGADADGNVATSVRLILNSTSTSSSNTELVYFTTAQGN